jgi:nucleoporin NDC1
MYAVCLEILKTMESRVDSYGKAPAPPPASAEQKEAEKKKRTTAPLKEDPIFVSTPQKKTILTEAEKVVGKVATAPGQPSQLSPAVKKAAEVAKDGFTQLTGSKDPQGALKELVLKFLAYPVGQPFRREYSRQLNVTVLDAPYGEPSLYVNTINAVSLLASHSLVEDKYGNVQRDVPAIIRTFTALATKLEKFKTTLPTHWSDVSGERNSPEVDTIIESLKTGLGQLIEDFGAYARDLRLTATEMRLAKELAATKSTPEMEQVPQGS